MSISRKGLRIILYFLILLAADFMLTTACRRNDLKKREQVADAVHYKAYQLPASLNRIHVLELEIGRPDISVHSVKAGRHLRDTRPLSAILSQLPDTLEPVAAVNGDFYSKEGIPSGAQVQNGIILKDAAESWLAFGITAEREPFIEALRFEGLLIAGKDTLNIQGINRPRLEGETVMYNSYYGVKTGTNRFGDELILRAPSFIVGETVHSIVLGSDTVNGDNAITDSTLVISTHGMAMRPILRRLKNGLRVSLLIRSRPDRGRIQTLIGGYPLLARDGQNMIRKSPAPLFGFVRDRYARSAAGISADKRKIFFVCAEGDQTGNRGLSLEELSDFMIRIGCSSALNLDGGGSSAMMIGPTTVNLPAEGGVERNISNAVVICRKKKPAG